jgi:folate-binding protein YgfZ
MYQLINVSGDDAEFFLQGQLTQDLAALTPDAALPAAWCTPKGRVVATMRLIRADNGIGLLLPAAIAATFLQRISIYKLRADVQFNTQEDSQGIAVQSDADLKQLDDQGLLPAATINSCASTDSTVAICISTDPLVIEVFAPTDETTNLKIQQALDEPEWRSTLIRSGLVRISADNTEKFTPHMISLDLAGAVSFSKGCYTGQEIVARTEHRGKSRRRLARYSCDASDIVVGGELFDGEVAVGTVVNVAGGDVLAVTPVDVHNKVLVVGGGDARPVVLAW